MDKYYFTLHSHHSNIAQEITLLNEISDKYFILSKEQTSALINHMRFGVASSIGAKLEAEGIISTAIGTPVSDSASPPEGVGLLQWTSNVTANADRNLNLWKLGKAWMAIIWAHRTLKRKGLHQCLEQCRRNLTSMRECNTSALSQRKMAETYGYQLKKIAPYMPFKVKCLEYSLALHSILTANGISSAFIIGFQRYDFLSHAWVEVKGVPILDKREMSSKIIPILRIGK